MIIQKKKSNAKLKDIINKHYAGKKCDFYVYATDHLVVSYQSQKDIMSEIIRDR